METVERDGARVAQMIRAKILRLELRPAAVLDEAELATQLKVSRTPVREAIIQLIADGLVVRDGRKAKVTPLDFDEVPKLFDALMISSRMIYRLAAVARTSDDLSNIRKQMEAFETVADKGSGVERSEVNVAFHRAIADAAHNRHFAEFYDRMLLGTIRLARACFSGTKSDEYGPAYPEEDIESHLKETARQHRAMVTAIEDKDVEESDRLAAIHCDLNRYRVEKVLFRTSSALPNALDLSLHK
ncbi:GntR family transcriptional regulator [Rhodobacteraceae bacterium]|nr:GntR family transcriptional regulator [Paracoccaceae bacterium]